MGYLVAMIRGMRQQGVLERSRPVMSHTCAHAARRRGCGERGARTMGCAGRGGPRRRGSCGAGEGCGHARAHARRHGRRSGHRCRRRHRRLHRHCRPRLSAPGTLGQSGPGRHTRSTCIAMRVTLGNAVAKCFTNDTAAAMPMIWDGTSSPPQLPQTWCSPPWSSLPECQHDRVWLRTDREARAMQHSAEDSLHVTAHAAAAGATAAHATPVAASSVGVARRTAVPVATATATARSTPVPPGELHPPPLRACIACPGTVPTSSSVLCMRA